MALLDVLPRNERGQIKLPVGAVTDEGALEGEIAPETFSGIFADYCALTVPLSAEQYAALLAASSPVWRLNWQKFRELGII